MAISALHDAVHTSSHAVEIAAAPVVVDDTQFVIPIYAPSIPEPAIDTQPAIEMVIVETNVPAPVVFEQNSAPEKVAVAKVQTPRAVAPTTPVVTNVSVSTRTVDATVTRDLDYVIGVYR